MSPRRSVAQAVQSRHAVLRAGVRLASVDGLEAVSLAQLADEVAMSKSGVAGQFGGKEQLQLAVLDEAARMFRRDVILPGERARPGIERLLCLAERWIDYLVRDDFGGGCFFINATAEYDSRHGRIRDALLGQHQEWRDHLGDQVRTAAAAGDLDADPEQLIFEWMGLMLVLNQALLLDHGGRSVQHARQGVRRLLGRA
ncbi:MAG: TetR/AcrR family transcriptional regulator [Propionibacteriaceae bacterium]